MTESVGKHWCPHCEKETEFVRSFIEPYDMVCTVCRRVRISEAPPPTTKSDTFRKDEK